MKVLFVSALVLSTLAPAAFAGRPANPNLPYYGCSSGGDETVRMVPVYRNGKVVGYRYECVQDNRGGGGGRVQ